jgi:hypothetical protein
VSVRLSAIFLETPIDEHHHTAQASRAMLSHLMRITFTPAAVHI